MRTEERGIVGFSFCAVAVAVDARRRWAFCIVVGHGRRGGGRKSRDCPPLLRHKRPANSEKYRSPVDFAGHPHHSTGVLKPMLKRISLTVTRAGCHFISRVEFLSGYRSGKGEVKWQSIVIPTHEATRCRQSPLSTFEVWESVRVENVSL